VATFIIGDIHGCLLTFRSLLEDNLGISKSDQIYLLGDFIDRGPRSAQLIEYLIDLKKKGYKLLPIRGNHEQMILDAMYSTSDYKLWMMNSGEITLQSYRLLLGSFFEFPDDMPNKHLLLLTKLPFYYEVDNYILVHGCLNFIAANPFSDTETMLWSRSAKMPENFLPGKVMIYGHTPTPLNLIQKIVSEQKSRMIPLDAGCVYTNRINGCGYLVALKMEDLSIHFVKNIDFK
jgi:serine/threonine protein phosphatase 1